MTGQRIVAFGAVMALSAPFVCPAAPVSSSVTRQVAINTWSELEAHPSATIEIVSEFYEAFDDQQLIHVYNFRPSGFVMVAADAAVIPVLGYGYDQHYGSGTYPPAFEAMLMNFKKQILSVRRAELPATREVLDQWNRLSVPSNDFEPMPEARDMVLLNLPKWGQDDAWNSQCPSGSGPGGHAWAGCAAVSMAQVMAYHQYPTQGINWHSYEDLGFDHPPAYGTIEADFGSTLYNWSSMLNNSSENNPEIQRLLFHCGVAVNMDYGSGGSGIPIDREYDLINAMRDYFGYANGATYRVRAYFADATWKQFIRDDIDENQPVIYFGTADGGSQVLAGRWCRTCVARSVNSKISKDSAGDDKTAAELAIETAVALTRFKKPSRGFSAAWCDEISRPLPGSEYL